jgi:enterochelin esterase-like enzyme
MVLAERLEQPLVSVVPGGHDWDTWIVLWRRLLGKQPFAI